MRGVDDILSSAYIDLDRRRHLTLVALEEAYIARSVDDSQCCPSPSHPRSRECIQHSIPVANVGQDKLNTTLLRVKEIQARWRLDVEHTNATRVLSSLQKLKDYPASQETSLRTQVSVKTLCTASQQFTYPSRDDVLPPCL